MRRRIWIPILIIGGLVAAFLVLRPPSEPEVAAERTAIIETGPLQVWVTGTGKVEPSAQAALSFRTVGTLGELTVEVGQNGPGRASFGFARPRFAGSGTAWSGGGPNRCQAGVG